jgi:cytochrome c oxidase subunit IV
MTLHAPQSDTPMHASPDVAGRHVGHPGQKEYVLIAVILAVITAIEVAVYYAFQSAWIFIPLSLAKFVLVAMFFMHLKFDSRFFSVIFVTGIVVAVAVFVVFLSFIRVFFA